VDHCAHHFGIFFSTRACRSFQLSLQDDIFAMPRFLFGIVFLRKILNINNAPRRRRGECAEASANKKFYFIYEALSLES